MLRKKKKSQCAVKTVPLQKCIFKKSFGHALQECGILVPGPGIELESPTAKVHSVNHWTAREVSQKCVLNIEEGKFIPCRHLVPLRFREPGKLFLTKKKKMPTDEVWRAG